MAYNYSVKDKKVIFSNDKVKNMELFELEFVTDAPKVCRLLRKETKNVKDPMRLIDTSEKENIKCSQSIQNDQESTFSLRFLQPYNMVNDVSVIVNVRGW